jgi:uncharacterized protein YjdB
MKKNFFLSLAVALICTAFITSCGEEADKEVAVESVSVTPTTLSLLKGTTGNITATVSPDNAANKLVKWSSDRPAIATVSAEGLVTALEVGTVNITATSDADASKKATVAVEVTPIIILVESVTTPEAVIAVEVNREKTLTATILPENATNPELTWSSSAPSVATINATTGVVRGIAAGTATMTVTATADPTKTATVSVIVVGAYVTEIKATPAALPYFYVGNTVNVSLEILPEAAEPKDVVWESSNESIVTVNDEGLLTAIAAGTAEITVSWALDAEVYATIPVQVRPLTQQNLLSEAIGWYQFNDAADLAKNTNGGQPVIFQEYQYEVITAPASGHLEGGPDINPGYVTIAGNEHIRVPNPATKNNPLIAIVPEGGIWADSEKPNNVEYTMMWDVRISAHDFGTNQTHALFQRGIANPFSDANLWIDADNTASTLRVGQSRYIPYEVPKDKWVRVVLVNRYLVEGEDQWNYNEKGEEYPDLLHFRMNTYKKYYVNGVENFCQAAGSGTARFNNILLFDYFYVGLIGGNYTDAPFDIAGYGFWDRAMTDEEVTQLIGTGWPRD